MSVEKGPLSETGLQPVRERGVVRLLRRVNEWVEKEADKTARMQMEPPSVLPLRVELALLTCGFSDVFFLARDLTKLSIRGARWAIKR